MKKKLCLGIVLILLTSIVLASYTEDTSISLTGLQYSSQSWADYNNDGDLDLAICGSDGTYQRTIIYKFINNLSGTFAIEQNFNITNVTECSVNWFDIDNDGWNDLLISGNTTTSSVTRIYKNNNGQTFTNTQNLTGVRFGSTAIGDIDNDKDLDLILAGCTSAGGVSTCSSMNSSVYINNGSTLIYNETWSQNLTDVWKGSLALGDYDNDGDLDLFLSGTTTNNQAGAVTQIYISNSTTFNLDANNPIDGIYWGSLALADYDNDTDIDLFIAGRNTSSSRITKVYSNDASLTKNNTKSSPPSSLSTNYTNNKLAMNWSSGSDTETATTGLYYNLRAGSAREGNDIVTGLYARSSNPTQGYFGNMLQHRSYNISIDDRCVFWQVQTIDAGLFTSDWSNTSNHSSAEICDKYDNDCDNDYNGTTYNSTIDEGFDKDNDSYFPYSSALNGTEYNCTHYTTYDCDDSDSTEYPGASCSRSGYTKATWSWNSVTLQCDCTGGEKTTQTYGGSSSSATAVSKESPSETPAEEEKETPQKTESVAPAESGEIEVPNRLMEKIADNRIEHTRKFYVRNGETQVIERIKNIDLFGIGNIKATLEAPKSVIETTDIIKSSIKFDVIEKDPKIQFSLGNLDPREEKSIEYTINRELKEEEINEILFKVEMEGIINEKEREDLFKKTQEVINITTTAKVDAKKNETEFTLNIDFINDSVLEDVNVYMEIPKCLVKVIEEMMIESDVEFDIVSKDPLIVWHFKKLTKGDSLNYVIKSIADEDCLNQAKTFAIARQIVLLEGQMFSPEQLKARIIIPLAILFALAGILLFLARYTHNRKRHIEKIEHIIKYVKEKFKDGFKTRNLEDKLILAGFFPKDIEEALQYHKKNPLIKFFNRHLFGGEVFFLAVVIILDILDFFAFLRGDIDFLEKAIGWLLLSYLLYEVSPMKALFGDTKFRKILDISLLVFFFSLIFKLVIEIAENSFNESVYFGGVLFFIAKYSVEATNISLYIGFIGLASVSLFITFFIPIGKPSFYYVVTSIAGRHKIENKHIMLQKVLKFTSVYLILLLFYITFYNFIFEWLAVAIDGSITIVAVFLTVIIFVKREYHKLLHHRLKEMFSIRISAGIEKIIDITESFNVKFFHLLSYKKFVYLAAIGILILHLVTEAGIFLIPYATGAIDPVYFSESGEGHTPVINIIHPSESLLAVQMGTLSVLNRIPLFIIYLANILAALFILINPVIIWLHMYKEKNVAAHMVKPMKSVLYKTFQLIFIMGISSLVLTPVFRIGFAPHKIFGDTEINEEIGSAIRGVDIKTQMIENYSLVPWVLIIAAILGIAYILLNKRYYRQITGVINTLNLILIVAYISMFYIDIYGFFMNSLKGLFSTNLFFFFNFLLFFIMSSAFYMIGVLSLVIELFARGEIYLPIFIIKSIKPLYRALGNTYHYLFPHHHLPHLIFYEHYVEAEHGKKEEHLHKHIASMIHHTHNNRSLLIRLIEKGVNEERHELYFIEEHLLEHNWPKEMVLKAIERARKDPELKKKIMNIKKMHHDRIALKKLAESVQEWYDKGHTLERIFSHAEKEGWTDEDIREILPRLKLRKKDRIIFKAYKM